MSREGSTAARKWTQRLTRLAASGMLSQTEVAVAIPTGTIAGPATGRLLPQPPSRGYLFEVSDAAET